MSENKLISRHFDQVLAHLYINPLERCNLACKICYTNKTKFILSNQQILDFVSRYQQVQKVASITFCGGEVFLLEKFPELVNQLIAQDIFIQIISNGTIDRLSEIKQTNMVNLIVSLDGVENYHDQNRGLGNFNKSVNFLKKAKQLGFNREIFSIVTKENLPLIPQFEKTINQILGEKIPITYHPRKPLSYLNKHPLSNVLGQTKGFNFLSTTEIKTLMQKKTTFPPKNLGCFQISLMSDGKIYGCCEGIKPIGDLQTDVAVLIHNLKSRLAIWDQQNYNKRCLGCVEKDFVCGLKNIL